MSTSTWRRPASRHLALAFALALMPAAHAAAQDSAAAHKRAADGKKVLTLADYPPGSESRIRRSATTANG